MARISVIVPVYNVSVYLDQCIHSIIKQSFHDLEIILVDDGSSDGSGEICDRYKAADRRIKVIHKPVNEGLVRARKTGVSAASSDYIGYVDGDDWIEPEMYETLYKLLIENDADVSVCSRYDDSMFFSVPVKPRIPEGLYDKKEMERSLFPQMIAGKGFFEWGLSPAAWDKLYKRSILEPAQMAVDDSLMMGEDAALTFPLMLRAERICVTGRCMYHYRQSDRSMVKTSADSGSGKECRRFNTLYYSVKSALKNHSIGYDFSEQWLRYVLFLMVPRADVLYEGIEKLDYLFPFSGIRRGERVVVYCAGLYGQRLYSFLRRSGICECVALADRNAEYLNGQGMDVILPEDINNYDYDAVAVASSYERTRNSIIKDLKSRLSTERVYGIDYETVCDIKSLDALGISSL